MNDQRIFECIADAQGPVSVQEIARQMGVDIDDARGQLAALLSVGDLVAIHGEYDFSERFKRGDVHAQLMKRAAAVAFAAKAKQGQLEDTAVMFLMTRGGRCSASEMHLALGLKPDQLASTELRESLRTGKLFKEGAQWMLDRRAVPRNDPAADLEEDLAAAGERRVQPIPKPVLAQTVGKPVEVPAPAVETLQSNATAPSLEVPVFAKIAPPPVVPHLRIAGHRQNGLRLQRGEGEPLVLSPEETRRLRNYLRPASRKRLVRTADVVHNNLALNHLELIKNG